MRFRARNARFALVALTAGSLLLGGCGKGSDSEDDDGVDALADDARNFLGQFANVPKAPDGSPEITGVANMTIAEGKTRVEVLVGGLDSKASYVAHVHNDVCSAADPGGAHYKFDADGGDQPPNEIHLSFADEPARAGSTAPPVSTKGGEAEVTVDREVGPEAKSVVIHVLRAAGASSDEAKPPKISCADLKPDDGSILGPASTGEPDEGDDAESEDTPEPTSSPSASAKPEKSASAKPSS